MLGNAPPEKFAPWQFTFLFSIHLMAQRDAAIALIDQRTFRSGRISDLNRLHIRLTQQVGKEAQTNFFGPS